MTDPHCFRPAVAHFAILRSAALLVPRQERAEWLAEWRSELWYVSQNRRGEIYAPSHSRWDVTVFCLGAYRDALWLRRNRPHSGAPWLTRAESPAQCGALLATLAALSLIVTFLLLPAARYPVPPSADRQCFNVFVFILLFAGPVFAAITALSLGESTEGASAPWAALLRGLVLFSAKIVLILVIVYCASHVLAYNSAPFIPGVLQLGSDMLGCVLAFRWALMDHRQRCPVCLWLLTRPVWVGDRSRYFLECNCTGLMCPKGHGFLYIPESPTSWFSAQRWLRLDSCLR